MIKFIRCSIDWSAQLAIRSIAGAIILLLLSSTLLTNLASGQVFPKSQAAAPIGSNKTVSTLSLTKHPKAHNVKITSLRISATMVSRWNWFTLHAFVFLVL